MLSSRITAGSFGEIVDTHAPASTQLMVGEFAKTKGERVHKVQASQGQDPGISSENREIPARGKGDFMDKMLETEATTTDAAVVVKQPQDPRTKLLGLGPAARPLLAKNGRPVAVTPEIAEQLCLLIAVGFSRRQAAAYLGICPTTITNAVARDPELALELRRAEELADLQPELTLMAKSRKNWRAAAWYMEHKRKHPRPLTPEEKEQRHQEKLEATRRRVEVAHAGFAASEEARRKQREAEEAAKLARRQQEIRELYGDDPSA